MNTNTPFGTQEAAPAQFLTRRELATRWKCSTETVKRRQTDGLLRPVRLSAGKLLYRLADIELIENGGGIAVASEAGINAGGLQ